MKALRALSRRSFLATVASGTTLVAAGCATNRPEGGQWDPLENAEPRDRGRVRPGREAPPTHCSDGDTGANSDPRNRGRRCPPR